MFKKKPDPILRGKFGQLRKIEELEQKIHGIIAETPEEIAERKALEAKRKGIDPDVDTLDLDDNVQLFMPMPNAKPPNNNRGYRDDEPTKVARLRRAMYGAVSYKEIRKIMHKQIEKALEGDREAAKFIFTWTCQKPERQTKKVENKTLNVGTINNLSNAELQQIEQLLLKNQKK